MRLPLPLRLLHYAIIANLAIEFAYASYMIFFVVRPPGLIGPLHAAAASVPFELMVTRRLYAAEAWIAFAGLAIYLGVTEILPRRLAR